MLMVLRIPGMGGNRWTVTAVEVAATKKALKNASREIPEHAHELIGDFRLQPAALRAAEAYAKRWGRANGAPEPCPCDTIQLTPKKKRISS
jgi:hypothetical protein